MSDSVDQVGLLNLCNQNHLASAFIAYSRDNNDQETQVETACNILTTRGYLDAYYKDVITIFRCLEKVGCGKFTVGRRGNPSRFIWSANTNSVVRDALNKYHTLDKKSGGDDTVEIVNSASAIDSHEEILSHTYYLRPEFAVTLVLPTNLTCNEAARLARLFRTLPMQ